MPNVENVVQEKVRTLLESELSTHYVAPLYDMFDALSIDVVSDYVFNRSFEILYSPTYAREFTVSLVSTFPRQQWSFPFRSHFSLRHRELIGIISYPVRDKQFVSETDHGSSL